MGNHNVGRAMAAAAKVFWAANGDAKVSKERALEMLDVMADDFIGADAEFDDEMIKYTALSRLVCIAFEATPDQVKYLKGECEDCEETDAIGEAWYDGPYTQFSKRYQFC